MPKKKLNENQEQATDEQQQPAPRQTSRSSAAKTYTEVLLAVDGLAPKMPKFGERFCVTEPEPGVRLLHRVSASNEATICADRALAGAIMRYCNNFVGKARFMLTFSQAQEVARMWMHNIEPVDDPVAVAELSDPRLTYRRLPFDLPPSSVDSGAPLFEEFLSRCSNSIALAAFIGSLFVPGADRQQYVWIHGAGENGKGDLAHVLHDIFRGAFHAENHAPEPDKIGPFWTSSFLGKRLVLFPDCTKPNFPMSGLFKSLTGGDKVRIEKKGKDAFSAHLNCKFMFFSNEELILSGQRSDLRRAIYCYVNPITGSVDTSHTARLMAEAPYIMRACLDVYERECGATNQRIPVEDGVEDLSVVYDSKFDAFFTENFEQTDDATKDPALREFVTPTTMAQLFLDGGIRSPNEQGRYLAHFGRVYGVTKVDLKRRHVQPRYRYVGLKRKGSDLRLVEAPKSLKHWQES